MVREKEFHFTTWSDGSITVQTRTINAEGELAEYSDSTIYTPDEARELAEALSNALPRVPQVA